MNRIRRKGATAEEARLAAAHFSTLVVYGQQVGLDAQFRTAMQALVRSKGRDAVLALDLDRAGTLARMKRYGLEVDERLFATLQPDHNTRRQALDDLSRFGITGLFAHLASDFERIAAELDRHRTRLAGIRLAQADDSWRFTVCPQLWMQIVVLSAHAAMVCAAMIFMPQYDSACALAQMTLFMYLGIYASMCP